MCRGKQSLGTRILWERETQDMAFSRAVHEEVQKGSGDFSLRRIDR